MSPDSVAYWAAAQALLDGDGLTVPWMPEPRTLSHWPPGLPLLLAAGGALLGVDLITVALVLNLAALAVSCVLVAWLVGILLGRWSWASAVASGVFATSWTILAPHAKLWSEPIFIAVILSHAASIALLLRGRGSVPLASLTAAASPLLRFLGVVVGPTSAILLWRAGRRRAAWTVGTLGVLPFGVTSTLLGTNRTLGFHPVSIEDVIGGLLTVGTWLAPAAPVVGLVLALAVAVAVTPEWRRSWDDPCLWLAGTLVATIVLSRLLADPLIPFDYRMLAPAQALLIPTIVNRAVAIGPRAAGVLAAAVLAMQGLSLTSGLAVARHLEAWDESHDAVRLARLVPEGMDLYSDRASGIWWITRLPVTQATVGTVEGPMIVSRDLYRLIGEDVCLEAKDAVLLAPPELCRQLSNPE